MAKLRVLLSLVPVGSVSYFSKCYFILNGVPCHSCFARFYGTIIDLILFRRLRQKSFSFAGFWNRFYELISWTVAVDCFIPLLLLLGVLQ